MSVFIDPASGRPVALNGKPSPFESPAEAFIAVLIACGHSDGDLSNVEIGQLSDLLKSRPAFAEINLVNAVKRLPKLFRDAGGLDQLLAAAAETLNESQREAAFVNAIDLAFTDGTFREEEVAFLLHMKEVLGLTDEFAEAALHIIGVKNRI